MQDLVFELPQESWTERFYSGWQYAFLSQVEPKGVSYPPFMLTNAWRYKDINTMLSSWAELKHDTILYAKMPEGLGGGGPDRHQPMWNPIRMSITGLHMQHAPYSMD